MQLRRKLSTPADPTPTPASTDTNTSTEAPGEAQTRAGRRPRRHLIRRWAGLASATVLLVGLTGLIGVAVAGPASAGPLGMCDSDMSVAAPIQPDAVPTDAPYSKTTESFGQKYAAIDGGHTTPADAYAGAGLQWSTFGLSPCGDAIKSAEAMMARDAYMGLVQIPLQMLGTLMQWAMSTAIANMILDAVLTPVTTMYNNIFVRWGVVAICAVAIGAVFLIARGRTQKAFSRLGWIVAVIVIVAGLATPAGLGLVRNADDVTSTVSGCLAFGFTSGCADTGNSSTMYTSSMEETFGFPVWAGGALGALADQEIPDTLTLKGHSGTPAIHTDSTFNVPKTIIPAQNEGHPTWAEAWRWSQTYTSAEMHAMADDASLKCGLDSAIKFEALTDPGTTSWKDPGGLGQICSYKWVTHAAIISNLYTTNPGVYTTVRGANEDALFAALSALGIWPLVLGIAIIGAMTLFYQMELITLFVSAPVVGVLAMRNPATGRKWGNMVVNTLLRRLAVGLTLGLVLWMVQLIVTGITSLSAHVGARAVGPLLQGTIVSILTIIAMFVGAAMFGKIKELLETTTGVEHDHERDEKLRKAGSVAVGAAAGALGAGSGARLMGGAAGMLRNARSGAGGNPVRSAATGFTAGQRAGAKGAGRSAAESGVPDRPDAPTPEVRPMPGPRQGDRTGARNAWDAIRATDDVAESRSAAVADAERRLGEASDALAAARRRLADHEATAAERGRAAAAGYEAAGLTPAAALARAAADGDQQRQQLAAMVRRADTGVQRAMADRAAAEVDATPLERELDRAARAGVDAARTAADLHLGESAAAAFAAYAHAVRPQPAPSPTGGNGSPWW